MDPVTERDVLLAAIDAAYPEMKSRMLRRKIQTVIDAAWAIIIIVAVLLGKPLLPVLALAISYIILTQKR